jgi:hypothetical protein
MSVLKNISAYYIKSKSFDDPILKEKVEDGVVEVFTKYFEPEDEKYIAIGDNDDFMFLFVEEYKVKALLGYLTENDLVTSYREVSNDIINGDIYDNEDFKSLYFTDKETIERFKSELGDDFVYETQFKRVFDNFILKNVTPDNILDKINEKGIEYLTDIDKEILKNG